MRTRGKTLPIDNYHPKSTYDELMAKALRLRKERNAELASSELSSSSVDTTEPASAANTQLPDSPTPALPGSDSPTPALPGPDAPSPALPEPEAPDAGVPDLDTESGDAPAPDKPDGGDASSSVGSVESDALDVVAPDSESDESDAPVTGTSRITGVESVGTEKQAMRHARALWEERERVRKMALDDDSSSEEMDSEDAAKKKGDLTPSDYYQGLMDGKGYLFQYKTRFENTLINIQNVLQRAGLLDYVKVDTDLLGDAIINYFDDIKRIKDFEVIPLANCLKIYAYETFWLLRCKPIQIVDQSIPAEYRHVNEWVFSLIAVIKLMSYEGIDIRDMPFRFRQFLKLLRYTFKYRDFTAKSLELAFTAFDAGYSFIDPTTE